MPTITTKGAVDCLRSQGFTVTDHETTLRDRWAMAALPLVAERVSGNEFMTLDELMDLATNLAYAFADRALETRDL